MIVIRVFFDLTEEDPELTVTILNSVMMLFIVTGLIKTYLKETVRIDKI